MNYTEKKGLDILHAAPWMYQQIVRDIMADEREKCMQAVLNVSASNETKKLFQDAIDGMTDSADCDIVEETTSLRPQGDYNDRFR